MSYMVDLMENQEVLVDVFILGAKKMEKMRMRN